MCDEREQVLEYLYDECDAAARRRVETHIASCDSCRDELRGWRSVRTDLLAWGVPEQTSVWTPFAPPKLAPWYRQVPAWAMAAAATLVFGIGAAGGFVARMAAAPVATTAAVQPTRQVPSLSDDQIRAIIHAELQSANAGVKTASTQPVDEAALMRRFSALVSESEDRMSQKQGAQMVSFYQDAESQRKQDWNNLSALVDARLKNASGQITGDVLRTVNRVLQAGQPDGSKKER